MPEIRSFHPDLVDKPIPKADDLEFQMVDSKKAIPHQYIEDYADLIAKELEKKYAKSNNDEDTMLFVVDALSGDKLLNNFATNNLEELIGGEYSDYNDQDKKEMLVAIARIRKALIKILEKKLPGDLYTVVNDYVRRFNNPEQKPILIGVVRGSPDKKSTKDQEFIYKYKELPAVDEHKEEISDAFKDALEIFEGLPPHPNIRNFIHHDSSSNESFLEKRDFITLEEYLNNKEGLSKEGVLTALKVVSDCLVAAKYLSDNGLMLQDMRPINIGVENVNDSNEKRGLLFDLDGLTKIGIALNSRMVGANDKMRVADMQDFTEEYGGRTSPLEMVYDLGRSIEEILQKVNQIIKTDRDAVEPAKTRFGKVLAFFKRRSSYEALAEDLQSLSKKMMALQDRHVKPKNRRLNLDNAFKELDTIIQKFERGVV